MPGGTSGSPVAGPLQVDRGRVLRAVASQLHAPFVAEAVAPSGSLEPHEEQSLDLPLADEDVPIEGWPECGQFDLSLHDALSGLADSNPLSCPLVSTLPDPWPLQARMEALRQACEDLAYFPGPVCPGGRYFDWSDDTWEQAIQAHLLTGDRFAAGPLHANLPVWYQFFGNMHMLHHPEVQQVLSWIADGYTLSFDSPFAASQTLHPRFQQRLARARAALRKHMSPRRVEFLLKRSQPAPIHLSNHASCSDHADFVSAELQNFLHLGAIEPHDILRHGPAVVSPMSVAVHPTSGKRRLCIDANYINVFERYLPVKFELLKQVFPLVLPGDYAYTTDLTKGYFHLHLHPSAQRFLAIAFNERCYVFKVLPFGLSSAVRAFTTLMHAIYLPMRAAGLRFSFMIDDRLALAPHRNHCWLDMFISVRIFSALGFHFGTAKCLLRPSKLVRYQGLFLPLDTGTCLVPADKLAVFADRTAELLQCSTFSRRKLAALAGLLVSFYPALPLGPLYAHGLFDALRGVGSWDDAFVPESHLRRHLQWLLGYVPSSNGKRFWHRHTTAVLATDASADATGGAALSLAPPPGVVVTLQGQLPACLVLESSTCREVAGMVDLLHTLLQHRFWRDQLTHGSLRIVTDSQCAAADVSRMRGAPPVFDQVLHLYEQAAAIDCDISVVWRPRGHPVLQFADLQSKIRDVGDWQIPSCVFTSMCQSLGVSPTIDWFAAPWNTQCDIFYSHHLTSGCSGVDAFDFCWRVPEPDCSYLCPPHTVIPRVLNKILMEKADCLLVLPAWFHAWHALLLSLPVAACYDIPGSSIAWGPRAPAPAERCSALKAGLRAYLVCFS